MNFLKFAHVVEQMTAERPAVTVNAERCVRSKDRNADCDLCVQRCPTDAISLENGVSVDPETCIHCGLCLHTCPVGVFDGNDGVYKLLYAAEQLVEKEHVEVACGHHPTVEQGDPKADAVLRTQGCLTSFGPSAYLGLLAMDVERVTVRLDACADCPAHELCGAVKENVQQAQDMLAAHDEANRLQTVEETPRRKRKRPVYDTNNPNLSRRGLFRMLSMQEQTTASDIAPRHAKQIAGDAGPPRERRRIRNALHHLFGSDDVTLPSGQGFVDFDVTDDCTACGLCAKICPNDAMRFESDDGTFHIHFDAAQCTDCGLCTSLCTPDALRRNEFVSWLDVAREGAKEIKSGELHECRKCHVSYSGDYNDGLCPVCSFRRQSPFGSRLPADLKEQVRAKRQKQNGA